MRHSADEQRGAALVLGLLLLALLSLLVTNAWSQNRWQQRIATHEIGEARAEAAARSALRWAEDWLMSLPGDAPALPCTGACTDTVIFSAGSLPLPLESLGERWWLDHAHADGIDPVTGRQLAQRRGVGAVAGRWIIEEAHFDAAEARGVGSPATSYYRIVARAVRVPQGTPVVLEAIVARPWGELTWVDGLPAGAARFCRGATAPTPCGRLSWRRRQ